LKFQAPVDFHEKLWMKHEADEQKVGEKLMNEGINKPWL